MLLLEKEKLLDAAVDIVAGIVPAANISIVVVIEMQSSATCR